MASDHSILPLSSSWFLHIGLKLFLSMHISTLLYDREGGYLVHQVYTCAQSNHIAPHPIFPVTYSTQIEPRELHIVPSLLAIIIFDLRKCQSYFLSTLLATSSIFQLFLITISFT